MNVALTVVLILGGPLAMPGHVRAQTWMPTSAPTNSWFSIASSADGHTYVAAGPGRLYTSTNSGASWVSDNVPSRYWVSVACSADGTLQAAVSSVTSPGFFVSTNSGTTWATSNVPSHYWDSIALSADGTRIAAVVSVDGSPVFVSTNSGASWTVNGTGGMPGGAAVASSADGSSLFLRTGPFLYRSTNSGTTWRYLTDLRVLNQNLTGAWFTCSADGTRLAVALGNAGIYTSTDSGSTWTSNSAPAYAWSSIACSADGSKLVAAVLNGGIYTSADSGATWVSNNAPNLSWTSVASSADGGTLVAAARNAGTIWLIQTTPTPRLFVSLSGSDELLLSWTIPSTNFVLQQNSDLTTPNWVMLTNMPALNLANLHNEVVLPLFSGNSFYRLSTP